MVSPHPAPSRTGAPPRPPQGEARGFTAGRGPVGGLCPPVPPPATAGRCPLCGTIAHNRQAPSAFEGRGPGAEPWDCPPRGRAPEPWAFVAGCGPAGGLCPPVPPCGTIAHNQVPCAPPGGVFGSRPACRGADQAPPAFEERGAGAGPLVSGRGGVGEGPPQACGRCLARRSLRVAIKPRSWAQAPPALEERGAGAGPMVSGRGGVGQGPPQACARSLRLAIKPRGVAQAPPAFEERGPGAGPLVSGRGGVGACCRRRAPAVDNTPGRGDT